LKDRDIQGETKVELTNGRLVVERLSGKIPIRSGFLGVLPFERFVLLKSLLQVLHLSYC